MKDRKLFMLFFLVVQILFFVGLIKAGKQVRFAKIAGILGLVLLITSIIFFIVIASNPLVLLSLLISQTIQIGYLISQIILYAAGLLALLFESLALFDASRKFESK